jgi:hypothetical protein
MLEEALSSEQRFGSSSNGSSDGTRPAAAEGVMSDAGSCGGSGGFAGSGGLVAFEDFEPSAWAEALLSVEDALLFELQAQGCPFSPSSALASPSLFAGRSGSRPLFLS